MRKYRATIPEEAWETFRTRDGKFSEREYHVTEEDRAYIKLCEQRRLAVRERMDLIAARMLPNPPGFPEEGFVDFTGLQGEEEDAPTPAMKMIIPEEEAERSMKFVQDVEAESLVEEQSRDHYWRKKIDQLRGGAFFGAPYAEVPRATARQLMGEAPTAEEEEEAREEEEVESGEESEEESIEESGEESDSESRN